MIFTPQSATTTVAVGTVSAATALPAVTNSGTETTAEVVNSGTNAVNLSFGGSSVATSATSLVLLPNSVRYFALSRNSTYFAVSAAATGNNVSVTLGV